VLSDLRIRSGYTNLLAGLPGRILDHRYYGVWLWKEENSNHPGQKT
jgi:hypothetical protein